MKRGYLYSSGRQWSTVMLALVMLLAVITITRRSGAQGTAKPVKQEPTTQSKTSHAKSAADKPADPDGRANEYASEVKKDTTQSYFMTELVDHLPMSDKVPSPDKVLGYVIGTPNKLTYTKDMYRYYRELAKASPRVKVFTANEKTEYGKEMLTVAVGSEEAIAKLDHYKEITAKLSDPRKLTDADANK